MYSLLAPASRHGLSVAPTHLKDTKAAAAAAAAAATTERLPATSFKMRSSDVDSISASGAASSTERKSRRLTSIMELAKDSSITFGSASNDAVDCLIREFSEISTKSMDELVSTLRKTIDELVRERRADGVPTRWSYVPILPVGRVNGKCLSLDFGCNDNYFMVAVCNIQESEGRLTDEEFRPIDRQAFVLTSKLRRVHMSVYCDFVAICVRKVLQDNGLLTEASEPVYVGIVAGFDARLTPQISPAVAKVPRTYKDYKMQDFLNCDFVASFQKSMDNLGLNVKIVTVLNDTVCTMLSGVHTVHTRRQINADCSIGVVSTRSGANVTFLESDQDFLDSCTTDRRLLLRSPRGNGYCVVVNPEIGMHGGEKGELNSFMNNVERNVLRQQGDKALRWECLSSGAWYFQLLQSSFLTMKALNSAEYSFPEGLTAANCFEVFSVCDNYLSDPRESYEDDKEIALAKELQTLLDPSERSVILPRQARVLAQVCQAIVGRSALMLAACIMAVASRVYGRAFPERMVVAYSGALFRISQLLPTLQKRLNAYANPNDASFPCKVSCD